MPSLEIEGPDSGWVATVGFDEQGDVHVVEARQGWFEPAQRLLSRLMQEPAPSGRPPGEHVVAFDEDVLYELASSLMRRKPLLEGERVTGYVSGGSRYIETPDAVE
jgi:hypothetical protein